ncbi:histidine kinase [Paenibacillus hexagrammi]|uniref:Oxygen sensor histidine kinase NreB n=1 Tax=Paenibacillus hexagrammi TaxID=2908839 RepID=A0ABY3SEF0_9BACL|nr:histidine kinase [Paenibacillus sp. YPD9-1]UJF31576.1 histidine kinase [Paenibacillus sp. YPD9-1]
MNLFRILTAVIGLSALALFAASIPTFYTQLRDYCSLQPCQSFYVPPPPAGWLAAHHVTPGQYAFSYEVIYAVFGFVYVLAGMLIYYKKPNEWLGLLGTMMLMSLGTTFTPITSALMQYPWLTYPFRIIEGLGFAAFILFFFMFPTGKFVPKWSMIAAFLVIGVRVPGMLAPGTILDIQYWSQILMFVWLFGWASCLIGVQIYRYKREMKPLERQQTKWVVYGLVVSLSGLLGFTIIYIIWQSAFDSDPYLTYLMEVCIHFSMLIIAVTLMMAILKHRLWDIDPLMNRTLVYGILTACVVGVYALSIGYFSKLLNGQHHWFASVVATGIVAVMFAPVKAKLQRWINRLMYGEQDDPQSVLVKLGKKLEEPMPPEEVLRLVVRTIKEALRLPYASLLLTQGNRGIVQIEDGSPQPDCHEYGVVHQGEQVAKLLLAPRGPGETFTASDRSFLETLMHQAATIVNSVKISLDVKLLAEDLQESRERLVLAREEERRRLRSNLHDDLAPRLAALAFTTAAAEELLESDPATSKGILAELRTTIRSTVSEVRSLVHNLRPPALDELGLIGAIRERINDVISPFQRFQQGGHLQGLHIELDAPDRLAELPAAVEVAAYRIATEGIVNVVRHSGATHCHVVVQHNEERAQLTLEITDNGRGLRPAENRGSTGGIGLASMRERAEELGGSFHIESLPQGGTKLMAALPTNE